jgi:hypothetical protein
MHTRSVTDLYRLARGILDEREDDDEAWLLFRDEAAAQFSAEDDGDPAAYIKEAGEIFYQAKIDAFAEAGRFADEVVS